MSHWAELDNENKVIRVLVCDNNDPAGDEGYQWLLDNFGGTWVQTSYNTHGGVNNRVGGEALRKNYAKIGDHYDGVGFYEPQPFPSWTKDEQTYLWNAPVAMPTDGKIYYWDEDSLTWIEQSS